ncbi:outer membrane beta-barrel protein [Methyloferula stellata]|uniref:outer membrane beta-barrel protein n=1 Tax=Methyloferula stellata TaxID=876270 RepID=UPI0012692A03|nr:outer membrane beta-barrel protein [Methyloferula stellata]
MGKQCPTAAVALALLLVVFSRQAFADDLDQPLPPVPPVATDESNFFSRLYHAYADEWGPPKPADPNAPASRRPSPFPPSPVDTPPYPFTEWPFGGATTIGASLPNSIDAPLQKAVGTGNPLGKTLDDAHIQIYGWVNPGGNFSTASGYAGNAPAQYMFTPNIVQLDQAVLFIERVPDTVQKDHIDWGFRVSGLYGENYRYATALGLFSNQLLYHNHFAGFDMPMVYGELYIPNVAEGLLFRLGRYPGVPDIESQIAPYNYMYSHSLSYVDAATNTGLIGTLKLTKNWMLQLGVTAGSDTMPWNAKQISLVNPVTGGPGYSGKRDPGVQPSLTACAQYQTDSAYDAIYLCANGINSGNWGYNNLQWYGGTYYHKFDDKWHIAVESYYMYQKGVLDVSQGYGSTAFAYMVNPPLEAHCPIGQVQCTAKEWSILAYLNYKITPMDNFTWRAEFFNDENGQRTGTATRYTNVAFGLQHWFSPSVEIRPEIAWYHSLDNPAFDHGTQHFLTVVSSDLIWHF